MKFVRFVALGAVLVTLAVGAIACGDDDDEGGDEPQATATTGSAPQATSTSGSGAAGSPTAPAGSGGDEVIITAADFSFSPATLTIDGTSNTTITLNNTGAVPHTIHIYYDEGYTDLLTDSGNVSPGSSGEVSVESNSVEQAPELWFRCNIHPQQMEGTITVEGVTAAP